MDPLEDLRRRQTVVGQNSDPLRAKPQPWFVGNGKGLMIGVLALCAVLIGARIVSIWWLAETAWHWWEHRPASAAPPALPPFPSPARPDVAGPARSDEADWISMDDYPIAAIQAGQQGMVQIAWTIGRDGRVKDCRVAASSGYRLLDEAACHAITTRGHYAPARDANGRPIESRKMRRVMWILPKD